MKLKIALLQILPGEDLAEQFMIGKEACEQAKAMGAHIALFPEMWGSGYYIPQDEKAVNEVAISAKDDFVHGFRALTADLEMAIGKSADYAYFILFQGHGELCDWFEADSGCMR